MNQYQGKATVNYSSGKNFGISENKIFAPKCSAQLGLSSLPLGSINRVPASAGVMAGTSPLSGGTYNCVIPYDIRVPIVLR